MVTVARWLRVQPISRIQEQMIGTQSLDADTIDEVMKTVEQHVVSLFHFKIFCLKGAPRDRQCLFADSSHHISLKLSSNF